MTLQTNGSLNSTYWPGRGCLKSIITYTHSCPTILSRTAAGEDLQFRTAHWGRSKAAKMQLNSRNMHKEQQTHRCWLTELQQKRTCQYHSWRNTSLAMNCSTVKQNTSIATILVLFRLPSHTHLPQIQRSSPHPLSFNMSTYSVLSHRIAVCILSGQVTTLP